MKLAQGYKQTQESADMTGNKTYKDVIVPYTDEQKQAILQRLFPNRFANVQPGSAGAQPASANPAPTTQPTAQPTAQTSTAANEPEWKKKLGW